MDTNKEDLAEVLMQSKAKKREVLSLVRRVSAYYEERSTTLHAKAHGMKIWTLLVALLGIVFLGTFIALGKHDTIWVGIVAVIIMGVAAYMATTLDKLWRDSKACYNLARNMWGLHDYIGSEPETLDTAKWFLHRYTVAIQNVGLEFQNARKRFGFSPMVSEKAAPIGDANKLMKTLDSVEQRIDSAVAEGTLTKEQAAATATILPQIIQNLSN